jgi:gamma-butyrobetaine dioxygenase
VTAAEIGAVLESLRALPEQGEAVDQLAPALQTAGLAIAAGADDDLVLAAALHDVGRAPLVAARCPGLAHEAAGAVFAASFARERTVWLVGAHVEAKRCLVARQPYADHLSARSTVTLIEQGGPLTPLQTEAFLAHPWAADALVLRQWDDAAKEPGAATPSVAEIVARLP